MADADVPITAGAGTKIDTRTVGAGVDEHRQVVVVGDPATAAGVASADAANGLDVDVTRMPSAVLTAETTKVIGVVRASDTLGNSFMSSGPGFLRTTDEPRQLFYDPFDGSVVDVTNRWTQATAVGTVTQASGQLAITSGATASGNYGTVGSQVSLVPTIPAWLGVSFAINFPDGAAPSAFGTRFFGFGSLPGTPTAAVPITDGVGFEMLNGKLYAVVYAAGVRTAVQDLSAATGNATQPTDALNHRYIVQVRTDRVYWYIDTLATTVATSNFQSPAVQTLPVRMISIASSAANVTLNSVGVAAWDTGKNSSSIGDPTYPWRRAAVSSAGALTVRQPGASSIATGQVVVTTTAATLVAARLTRNRLILMNNSNQDIYVGPATVTTANGLRVAAGWSLTLHTTALVQAIIGAGLTMTGDVDYLEEFDA